jgi:predicted acylesterase/phospholipase RssA
MITNLVLSGGGQAGFSYIGVMRYLEETGHINNIKNILGVSIGSIFSLMITLNINSKQFGNLLKLVNTEMGEINIHNILSFFDTFGIDDCERITKLIKACIKVKLGNENATFEDINNYNKNKNLLIFTTNLTKKEKTIFSFDKTPHVELWKAIRASCTYPLYFQPIKIDDDLYVDGGVSCNYPIYYFKDDIENTLGISFLYTNNNNENDMKKNDFVNYISSIFMVIIGSLEKHIIELYKEHTIQLEIPISYITDYKMSRESKEEIYELGYNEFKKEWKTKFPDDIPSETASHYNENWENELEDIRSHMN